MLTHQRLLRRTNAARDGDSERDSLAHALASAPGVRQFEIVEPHVKGGYRVLLDLDESSLDDFIAHLEAHDWMSVL